MAGYTIISDEELSMNIYIKEDRISKYIMFKREDKAKEEKLYLESRPITF
jgi:CTP:phosphocholine cytidylyltransferase-like protein